jgi:hypothetical protein
MPIVHGRVVGVILEHVNRRYAMEPGAESAVHSNDPLVPKLPLEPVDLTRRQWLGTIPALVIGGATSGWATSGWATSGWAMASEPAGNLTDRNQGGLPSLHDGFPRQDPQLVQAVVDASHGNLARVRELVEAWPALAKASWDWGFGDWESALGAASHTGRREIAELLMDHGARANVFTFAMLGRLSAVKACIEAQPGIEKVPGPHGITLLQHARGGGDAARSVVTYLEKLGSADVRAMNLPLSDSDKETYLGRYHFGVADRDSFDVSLHRRGFLAIKRGDEASRRLNRVESHAFAPAGAPEVRIRFDVADGRAVSLTVHDPAPMVRATRVNS